LELAIHASAALYAPVPIQAKSTMNTHALVLAAALAVAGSGLSGAAEAAALKPNIIIIFTDR
jgi:hypothetical protein